MRYHNGLWSYQGRTYSTLREALQAVWRQARLYQRKQDTAALLELAGMEARM